MNGEKLLFLALGALVAGLIFGLSGVSAQHYGYGYGSGYGYGYNYGGSYSSHIVKTSPYYNYEKSVYKDPWSYTSTVRRSNYGNSYYSGSYPRYSHSYRYPSYHSGYSYRNNLGRYMNYGYYPPQYVSRTVHRSYY